MVTGQADPGVPARRLALDVLERIESDGAYANLVLRAALDRSELPERDRRFVTDLVYGTTRLRRACDHLVEQRRKGKASLRVRLALRLGAYQLLAGGVAPHAAVSATVGATPRPARGLANAVLRRVAEDVAAGVAWPSDAVRLSYPDWIVTELRRTLGSAADAALEAMNRPATTHVRDDGYVQDAASQRVSALVGAQPGERVLDLCAAPGGKATALAATGATVVAVELGASRARLVAGNAARLGASLPVVCADGTAPPFRGGFDRVLVDAPCSGLGVLRRRSDARWRIQPDDVDRLAELQVRLVESAASLIAPGGTLVYAVCTLTSAETTAVADAVDLPGFERTLEETLVPDDDSDGMYVVGWTRRSAGPAGAATG